MNTDELAALCQRVRDEQPPEIQVCCPHGHFIVAVAITGGSAPFGPLMMWPALGRDHHLRVRRIPTGAPEPDVDNPDFTVTETPQGLAVALSCRRCPRWTLVRDYQRLAAELAVYALAGHTEHRIC